MVLNEVLVAGLGLPVSHTGIPTIHALRSLTKPGLSPVNASWWKASPGVTPHSCECHSRDGRHCVDAPLSREPRQRSYRSLSPAPGNTGVRTSHVLLPLSAVVPSHAQPPLPSLPSAGVPWPSLHLPGRWAVSGPALPWALGGRAGTGSTQSSSVPAAAPLSQAPAPPPEIPHPLLIPPQPLLSPASGPRSAATRPLSVIADTLTSLWWATWQKGWGFVNTELGSRLPLSLGLPKLNFPCRNGTRTVLGEQLKQVLCWNNLTDQPTALLLIFVFLSAGENQVTRGFFVP